MHRSVQPKYSAALLFVVIFMLYWFPGTEAAVVSPRIPRVSLFWLKDIIEQPSEQAHQHILGNIHAPGDDTGKDDGFRWTTRGFASLGDSYSAGIGTGFEGKEDDCRLGVGAYPELLYGDFENKAGIDKSEDRNTTTAFQWLSCTGSTTDQVLGTALGDSKTSQIDNLRTGEPHNSGNNTLLDFVTLSIGGNDLGFFDVINACIFRFYGYYSGTCEAVLEAAEALVDERNNDDIFTQRLVVILLQILDRVRWEKHPGFRIVVTGYARFFNAETDICDTCSLSIWWSGKHNDTDGSHPPPAEPGNGTDSTLLTRELRRRMNGLVAGTNRKLQTAIDQVNGQFGKDKPRVLFVDYDAAFEGHRFCEPGVVEPDYEREETWFFLVGGQDNNHTVVNGTLSTGVASPTLSALSPLVDPDGCLGPARARGDWGELALCYMARAQQTDPTLRLAPVPRPALHEAEENDDGVSANKVEGKGGDERGISPQNSMWYVPTYYGKTFHPRSNGHKVVRDTIYRVWEEHGV